MENLQYKILEYIDPQKILYQLKDQPGTILLNSSRQHDYYGKYSFIVFNPVQVFIPDIDDPLDLKLSQFEGIQKSLRLNNSELPPFIGGLVGYFSYDFNRCLEPILEQQAIQCVPDYWFGLYNQVIAFDHSKNQCLLIVTQLPEHNCDLFEMLYQLEQICIKAGVMEELLDSELPNITLTSNFVESEYIKMVQSAQNYILNGDIFEVNLAQCFSGNIPANYDSYALYRKLCALNPAPFSAYIDLGELKILSASPERFLKVSNNQIEVRPIKGTIKRNPQQELDKILAQQLMSCEKDRAENIMIVDLMRNDLSKICTPSSVIVKQLCGVESFTNLHHLVSVIAGELKLGTKFFDIIKACFPGGSVTGAPKIRAMQIINELEKKSREVYCGSIGYFSLNGHIDLSIAIRTIIINQQKLSFSVGGAVTLKSDPLAEYQETMLKGQKLNEVLNA